MFLGRRVGGVVVLALVGLAALAGCRTEPTVAAYIGQTKITEAQVDELIADATRAAAKPEEKGTAAPGRGDVVGTLVLIRVCEQARAKLGFDKVKVSTEQVRQSEGVPSVSRYATIRADLYGCITAIPYADQTPTDAELRELYDRAVTAGLVGTSYEETREQLLTDDGIRQRIAIDRAMTQAAKDASVTVNPRYRPLEFPLIPVEGGSIMEVTLGELASDAVRDLR
ncbi:MAG: hypothetical protein ACM30G_21010 [Micromonosporaceae bacterium]